MPKVWLVTSLGAWRQRGFLTIEVLLAAAVFGFVTVAVVGAFVYGRQATAGAGDYDRAAALAEEGVEAIRNIRDNNFTNLPAAGTYYLSQSGNIWSLVSSPAEPTINGLYTRQVTIANVDGDRKTATVTVSWTINGKTRQATATSRLTDWQAAIVPPGPTNGPIMMAYSKTTAVPYYRIWDGSAWGAEASASSVTGNINFIVLKSAATRNEAVMGVQTDAGAIYFQVWDGSAWSLPTQIAGSATTTTRSFDIAYEKTTDRAIITYSPSSVSADFAYRIWDGSTLSSATNVTAPPTTGAINWIETKQNPVAASNEIAMIMIDANSDVYGMRWTGSAWNNMGTAATWDATASTPTRKGIDVEYEQSSGHILFAWGDATSTDNYYRTWNGTTLSAATLLDVPAMGGVANWVQLAARPGSDEILFGVQDAGSDLNTRKWSGTAWDTATQHPEHEASGENAASRNFDLTWETYTSNLGKAWLVWGDGATRSERQWSGTAWGSIVVASGSDDTSFVRLRADPVSGAVFSGIYQCSCSAGNNRDINERHLTGGSSTWTASNQLWGGPTTADPVHFKIDIATP